MSIYTRISICALALATVAGLSSCNMVQVSGFGDAQHFVTGDAPLALAIADFNGDGNLDVVTANSAQNVVALLLGAGDGTFQLNNTFGAASGIKDVTVGDLNEDGHPDVITGNDGTISILLNNTGGAFAAPNNIFSAGVFTQVILADFNKDGNLDYAASSAVPFLGGVFVRLGNGDGTFANNATTIGNPNTPISVAAGDFNGDGHTDIITANTGNSTVSVYPGAGTGAFGDAVNTSTGPSTSPNAVAAGDFDGDGNLDAVTANVQTGSLAILLGNGDGTFTLGDAPGQLSFAAKVAVGDVDGDGNQDIVTANSASNDITLLFGLGDGTFTFQNRLAVGTQPFETSMGDVNNDGLVDLISVNRDSDDISVLLRQAN